MGIWDRFSRRLDELAEELLPEDLRELVDGARELIKRGEYRAAALALEQVLAAKPEHATALYLLGTAQLRAGNAVTAADAFTRAKDVRAGFTEAIIGLGETRLALGEPAMAITRFREALAMGGNREALADAYRGLGLAYLASGTEDKGVRELRKALAEDPEDVDAAIALAETLLADPRLDPEETRVMLERICKEPVRPAPAAAFAALGRLELRAGHREAADQALTRALGAPDAEKLSPGARLAAMLALVDARAAAGDQRGAHEIAVRALAVAPKAPGLHARLARLHLAASSPEAAIDAFERAYALGQDRAMLTAAIDVALERGLDARASQLAAQVIALPGRADRERGLLAFAAGDLDAARTALELALPNREAALVLARVELAAANPARAAALALGILRVEPHFTPARRLYTDAIRRELGLDRPAGDLYALATRVHALLTTRAPDLAPEAARAIESFDRPLLVTVMGEFSSGKSTFVNAFLGAEVAPVGITPTTATINVLKYGRERGGRIVYTDDQVRELAWEDIPRVLRAVDKDEARRIRFVEILYPLDALARVNIVDTPGLNSILPEHEATARQFIAQADAIVWLFTIGQAGKATEREALEKIQAEGKRVLGVVNKIDQASPEDAQTILHHLRTELGAFVEDLVPVSARRALEARRTGADLAPSSWPKLEQALEEHFFRQARALKMAACRKRLGDLLAHAHERLAARAEAATAGATKLAQAAAAARADSVIFNRQLVPEERRLLAERTAGVYRAAAREVLELVRPRKTPFGANAASAADRDYLVGFFDRALDAAVEPTRQRVVAELRRAAGDAARATDDTDISVDEAIDLLTARVFDRGRAYLRGYLRGGRVDEFFARVLPKLELTEDSVYHALVRDAPDLDAEIAIPLAGHAEAALRAIATRLDALSAVAAANALEAEHVLAAVDSYEAERRS